MTQDDISGLAMLPRALARIVQQGGDEALDFSLPGEWSIRTTMAHLRDEEALVFRLRVERMLAEHRPLFAPYPPEAWLAGRNTARDSREDLLFDIALQRQASISLLGSLRESDLAREGEHPTMGVFTVATWTAYWLKHDREHLEQMERMLAASQQARS